MTLDPKLIATRFGNALGTYDQAAQAQKEIAHRLVQYLMEQIATPPSSVLEIGCGTGFLTQELSQQFPEARYTLNDLVPQSETILRQKLPHIECQFLMGDAEQMEWGNGFHLIASSSAIQWWHTPTHFFTKAHQSLTEEGWLACSTFLPDNLGELTPILSQTLPYPTAQEYRKALALFSYAESHQHTTTLYFPHLLSLLQHLKATGTNALPSQQKGLWTPHRLKAMETTLRNHLELEESDPIPLTYKAILFIAKK